MAQTIASVEGFIRKIRALKLSEDELVLYRGHSNKKQYKLIPSVLRDPKIKSSENLILKDLVASHPSDFSSDTTTLEKLARVQHYSLPSRLLDLTWNPLVALYFAANEHDGTTGQIIVFTVKKSLIKYYDSDTASCISNLSQLSPSEREKIEKLRSKKLSIKKFNKEKSVDRLLQFIRAEKPHFRPEIIKSDLFSAIVVKPKMNNERLIAQAGAFMLFGLGVDMESNPPSEIEIQRININGNKKKDIRKELDSLSINDSTMFPEIEKAAIYIKQKIQNV